MQYRASGVDKMNIEPAVVSTESKSFFVFFKFQMDYRWSEYVGLTRKQRNSRVKLR